MLGMISSSGPSAGLRAAASNLSSRSRASTNTASLSNVGPSVSIPAKQVNKLVGPATAPSRAVNLGSVVSTMPAPDLPSSMSRVAAQRAFKANMAQRFNGSALRGSYVDLRL